MRRKQEKTGEGTLLTSLTLLMSRARRGVSKVNGVNEVNKVLRPLAADCRNDSRCILDVGVYNVPGNWVQNRPGIVGPSRRVNRATPHPVERMRGCRYHGFPDAQQTRWRFRHRMRADPLDKAQGETCTHSRFAM